MIALFAIPYMGWTSRMCGGGRPNLPFGLEQWLLCLPYIVLLWPLAGSWSLLAYAGAVLGARTGIGRGNSLKLPMKEGSEPEKLEYLILWLQPRMSIYAYKSLLNALTGLAVPLAPAIACFACGEIIAGLVLAASGIAKIGAYMIGWEIENFIGWPENVNEGTEVGELLRGLFLGAGVYAASLLF